MYYRCTRIFERYGTGWSGEHQLVDINRHLWDWAAHGWTLVHTTVVTNTAPHAQEVIHFFYWQHPGYQGLAPSEYPLFPQEG